MNRDCLDIGKIQAFLDGELGPDALIGVSGHIAACDACSAMLGEAEEESAFVFPVLEREMNTLVPTQRLWARINDSIKVEKENTPFWKKILADITASLKNPSIAVAAAAVVVFGIFAVVYSVRSDRQAVDQPLATSTRPIASAPVVPVVTGTDVQPNDDKAPAAKPRYDSNDLRASVIKANYTRAETPKLIAKGPEVVNADYLPGEESYVKTINNLSQTVAGQKDSVMRPSQLIGYERDLAVVDDSIKRMRKEVRKNPKNESAKQVLYTSYQNKIDLLNSVAQKEELVASLK